MTCAGRSRSRSLARPVSARTRRTSPIGNVPAITPRLMWSLTRMPAGRPAGMRAIVAARPRTSASMAQPCSYVNRIGLNRGHRAGETKQESLTNMDPEHERAIRERAYALWEADGRPEGRELEYW